MQKIIAVIIIMVLTGCIDQPIIRHQGSVDGHGCLIPDPVTFTKLGIDAKFTQSTFGKVVTGDINVKTDPQVIDLVGKAARESSLRDYLRCLAIKRDGYNNEQAAHLDRLNVFAAASPSADQFIKWQQENPFPAKGQIDKRIESAVFSFDVCSGQQAECIGLPSTTTGCHLIEVTTVPPGRYVTSVNPEFERGQVIVGANKAFSLSLSPHPSAHLSPNAARYIKACGSSADDKDWRQTVVIKVNHSTR